MATLQDLYPALSAVAEALRSQPTQIKAMEAQLDQVLKVPHAYNAAQELASQKSIPEEVRQLALSRVKNMVVQTFATNSIFSDEDREQIKARVMQFLDEPNNAVGLRISYHNETIAGKIARQDFPRTWPNIITDLAKVIQESAQKRLSNDNDPTATLVTRRTLQVLGAVLDEYSSKVLATTTPVMIQLTGTLLNPLSTLYGQFSARYFSRLNPGTVNDPDVGYDVEIAQLLFRSITRLMIYVWNRVKQLSPQEDQIVSEFFQNSVTQLQSVFNFRVELIMALHSSQQFSSLNAHGEHTLKLLKDHIQFVVDDYFRAMQKQPGRVEDEWVIDLIFIKDTNQLNLIDEATAAYPSHFLCSAMLLFRESLAMWSPNRQNASEGDILPSDFVEGAVQQLVQTFLPLSDASLELWSEDPEGFIEEEEKGGDAWEIDPRYVPSPSDCFASNDKLLVLATATTDLATAKQKEAYYAAIGRCAHRLKDVIGRLLDYDVQALTNREQILTNGLLRLWSRRSAPQIPFKRRVAWVIAKWYSDKQLPASDGTVWEVLRYLVQDQGEASDLVVRLTAAIAVGECVDTLGFNADVFQPHLPFVIEGLVQLASSCDTYESKTRVINVVPLVGPIQQHPAPLMGVRRWEVMEQCGYSGRLCWYWPRRWSREQSESLIPIVVPLIRQSLTPEVSSLGQVQDIDLTSRPVEIALGPGRVRPMACCHAQCCLTSGSASRSTQPLGADSGIGSTNARQHRFLHGPALFDVMKKILSSFNVRDVLAASELIFRLADPTSWPESLHNSAYFWDLLKNVIEDKDPNVFNQLITAGATAHQAQEGPLFEGLLDQWWNKLTGMGIAALVSTGRHEIMDRLSTEILNMWMDIHGELKESQVAMDEWIKGGSNPDEELHLHWERGGNTPPDTFMRGSEDTPEEARRKQVKFTTFVAEKMQQGTVACGGQEVLQTKYLKHAEPALLQQLEVALASGL
ncbi:ran binding protein 11 [Rhizoctonia solani AG-1 IA]|uniref:Ran binding protein 11 n=1 Tax=Thanatephorus cucumeris (strain AG1-IA) TaxID=983506 RepID=L8XB80_THACA|nr:ran binding protein 11 [Rhizoctonia solani AG-1 IA]